MQVIYGENIYNLQEEDVNYLCSISEFFKNIKECKYNEKVILKNFEEVFILLKNRDKIVDEEHIKYFFIRGTIIKGLEYFQCLDILEKFLERLRNFFLTEYKIYENMEIKTKNFLFPYFSLHNTVIKTKNFLFPYFSLHNTVIKNDKKFSILKWIFMPIDFLDMLNFDNETKDILLKNIVERSVGEMPNRIRYAPDEEEIKYRKDKTEAVNNIIEYFIRNNIDLYWRIPI